MILYNLALNYLSRTISHWALPAYHAVHFNQNRIFPPLSCHYVFLVLFSSVYMAIPPSKKSQKTSKTKPLTGARGRLLTNIQSPFSTSPAVRCGQMCLSPRKQNVHGSDGRLLLGLAPDNFPLQTSYSKVLEEGKAAMGMIHGPHITLWSRAPPSTTADPLWTAGLRWVGWGSWHVIAASITNFNQHTYLSFSHGSKILPLRSLFHLLRRN